MDGRVKTLHPKIHGGLLGRRGTDDAVMAEHGIEPIDLVAVNLYPFAATVAKPGCTLRGRDREHRHRRPGHGARGRQEPRAPHRGRRSADYGTVLAELDRGGGACRQETRLRLATKAFAHTAQYDAAVASYLARARAEPSTRRVPATCSRCSSASGSTCATARTRTSRRRSTSPPTRRARRSARPRSCRARSFRSTTSPMRTPRSSACASFAAPACVIVKHANPCGVAIGASIGAAYDRAFRTDPTSAFGGIIAFNRPLDGETAARHPRAPVRRGDHRARRSTPEAREACAKKENVRLLVTGGLAAEQLALRDPQRQRRPAAADARRWHGRGDRAAGRDAARADARRAAPT